MDTFGCFSFCIVNNLGVDLSCADILGIKPLRLAKWVHFRLFSAFSAITSIVEMPLLSPYNKLTEIP